MKKNRELYQALELAGLIPLLVWWGIERIWPERMLLQAVVLLPGTVLLGAASVLHWRLPPDRKERVTLSWRLSPVHVYLLFLACLVMNAAAFLEAFRREASAGLTEKVLLAGILLLLAGELAGYFRYFRQKGKSKQRHPQKKKRGEDPWN